ncbi:MAG TPA: hypothetical protein VHE37_08165 [Nevskiaceae bacterium]|nr:hypothetical protein [Nevskiaceae bacterium]
MANDIPAHGAPLAACSALGVRAGTPVAPLVEDESLCIVEEPLLAAVSLRQYRAQPDSSALVAALAEFKVAAPAQPNAMTGDSRHGAAWIEPHAWLVTALGDLPVPVPRAGLLVTDVSDRYAALRISGARARSVIAAGCDPAILAPMRAARTRFGGVATALIQQWGEDDYRVLVDVSLAQTVAAWLRQAAAFSRELS